MDRIAKLFEQPKPRLALFFTAGYPQVDATLPLLEALDQSPVDLIEIGMPFSDPLADGPVIRKASEQALANGMQLDLLFHQLKNARRKTEKPIVLMGYLNPLLAFGMERFLQQCVDVGIDGVIIPDLPPEVFVAHYQNMAKHTGIKFIFMVTPETSEDRIRYIDAMSEGFIYMVRASGTTGGAATSHPNEIKQYANRLKHMQLSLPYMLGFGISDSRGYQEANDLTEGAIIGTAFIEALEGKRNDEWSATVNAFVDAIVKG